MRAAVARGVRYAGMGLLHLGRACAEYRIALIGEDEGRLFRSDVRLLVWEGLVLVREVRDAELDDLRAVAEVVELDRD